MIAAIVLAAGHSKRMGRPKMSLAWGKRTVLGQVLAVFQEAGVEDVLVVSGGDREAVEAIAAEGRARVAFNPDHAAGEMLGSLQVGIRAMRPEAEAAFVALGDQPQVEGRTVRRLVEEYRDTSAPLIVPSFEMRRGHPWLVARPLWNDILGMASPETPRDFLEAHKGRIRYVSVDTPSVLEDLDTPDDYWRARR